MDIFIFFISFSSIFVVTVASDANCSALKCSHGDPDICFPFRVQGQQTHQCSHPGFELICKQNKTIIHFPSYGNLVVKSISYDTKKLNLLDPKNCVHEVFLNLNLSLTPFHYYYVVKNYTYLNCSSVLSSSFTPVPCLSGPGYHVYDVESSLSVPISCNTVKTIAIPFSYSPYLSDNSFGLGLTWDLSGCKDCEAEGGWSGFQSKLGLSRYFNIAHGKVLSISVFIFMAATLIGVKTYCYKKLDRQNEKKNQFEAEKLLGSYETFKPAKYPQAGAKELSNQIENAV
ncbi:hypothetical protein F0562_007866 [Nyssa sinensis]|uniref:RING-type E3 ubiquitin transferase n=1 Tax=Nyssa sinensis TaxID=561372 RepID=A0A5J5A758_9ASTE|nr:hypothetical protein F0562_007866 [Nyssa sinensis]